MPRRLKLHLLAQRPLKEAGDRGHQLSGIAEIPGQKGSLKPEHTCKLDRGLMVLKEGTGVQIADQTQYYCRNSSCKSDKGACMVSKEGTRVEIADQNRYYCSTSHCKSDKGAHMVLKGGMLMQNMGSHCFLCKYNYISNCKCVNKLYIYFGEGNKGLGPPSKAGGSGK